MRGLPASSANICSSIKGGSYARFRLALDTGNSHARSRRAAELPRINLDDALRVCALFRADPPAMSRR
jgi:hypothetical protein